MIDNTKKVLRGRGVFLCVRWGVELRERGGKDGGGGGGGGGGRLVVWRKGTEFRKGRRTRCENPRLEKKRKKKLGHFW